MNDDTRYITNHAVHRYQRRIDPKATRDDALRVLREGEWRSTVPLDSPTLPTEGYVINGDAVFPMERGGSGELVAATCIRRKRRAKADCRAWREQQREDDWRHAA